MCQQGLLWSVLVNPDLGFDLARWVFENFKKCLVFFLLMCWLADLFCLDSTE